MLTKVPVRSSLYLVIMKPHLCYATHIGLLVRESLKLKIELEVLR